MVRKYVVLEANEGFPPDHSPPEFRSKLGAHAYVTEVLRILRGEGYQISGSHVQGFVAKKRGQPDRHIDVKRVS